MARDFDGSTGYLGLTSAIITAEPLTMACWINPDNATVSVVAMSISNAAGNARWQLSARGAAAGDPIGATVVNAASGAGTSNTSTSYSAGAWQHIAAVFASSSSRASYLNGGGAVEDTASVTSIGALDRTSIGASLVSSAVTTPFDGRLAEAAFWNVALTTEEIQRLSLGFSPLLVRPESIVAYVPIIGRTSPETNLKGTAFTVNGTATQASHPRIIYPALAQVITAPAATFNPAWARGSNILLGMPT